MKRWEGWHCPRCNSIKPPKALHCPDCKLHFDGNYKPLERTWEEQEEQRMGLADFEGRKD